jgi:hypothetical protein
MPAGTLFEKRGWRGAFCRGSASDTQDYSYGIFKVSLAGGRTVPDDSSHHKLPEQLINPIPKRALQLFLETANWSGFVIPFLGLTAACRPCLPGFYLALAINYAVSIPES